MAAKLTLDEAPGLLSVAQCAQVLGISENHTRAHLAAGELPSVRIGRRIVIPRHLLLAHLSGEDWRDPEVQRRWGQAAMRTAASEPAEAPAAPAGFPDLAALTPEQARVVGAVLGVVVPMVQAMLPAPAPPAYPALRAVRGRPAA